MKDKRKKRIWIDPQCDALSFLNPKRTARLEGRENGNASADNGKIIDAEYERLGVASQNGNDTQAVAPAQRKDVVPPEPRPLPVALIPPKPPQPAFSPGIDLAPLERTIRQMARTLDFDLPEGLLDKWFCRRNHRIRVKAERAELINQFQTTVVAHIRSQCDAAEEVLRHNQIRYQQMIEALIFWETACEKQLQVFNVEERVRYQCAIEEAKAHVEIEKCNAEVAKYRADAATHARRARDMESDLKPPPPPAPPPPPEPRPPTREEMRAQNKQRIQDEIDRLKHEEEDDIWRLTNGKPEAEWPPEVVDEVKRVQNQYAHAREHKRNQIRRYL